MTICLNITRGLNLQRKLSLGHFSGKCRAEVKAPSPSTSWSSCSSPSCPKSAWTLYYRVIYAICYIPACSTYFHMYLLQDKCGASEQFWYKKSVAPEKDLVGGCSLCLRCSSCPLLFTCLSLLHPLRLNLGVLLLCQEPFSNPCPHRSLSMLPACSCLLMHYILMLALLKFTFPLHDCLTLIHSERHLSLGICLIQLCAELF